MTLYIFTSIEGVENREIKNVHGKDTAIFMQDAVFASAHKGIPTYYSDADAQKRSLIFDGKSLSDHEIATLIFEYDRVIVVT